MAEDNIVHGDPSLAEYKDFTAATDWEKFTASVEQIIEEWKLSDLVSTGALNAGDLARGEWKMRCEPIYFASFRMIITRHYLVGSTKQFSAGSEVHESLEESEDNQESMPFTMEDLLSFDNDFPPKAHFLARWYGVRDFLLITPDMDGDNISSAERQKILLGSLCTALRNTNCSLPAFVQVHHPRESIACGVLCAKGFHCYFNMVKLMHTPKGCGTLSGLLDLFKNKLCNGDLYTHLPVDVSIRFTYVLNDWSLLDHGLTLSDHKIVENKRICDIHVGSLEEPLSEFRLMVTWPRLAEDVVNDSIAHSDLVPAHAPEWCVTVKFVDGLSCNLERYLRSVESLLTREESLDIVLGSVVADRVDPALADAMDRLTESKVPDLTAAVIPGSHSTEKSKSFDEEMFVKFMSYIFITPLSDKVCAGLRLTPEHTEIEDIPLSEQCEALDTSNDGIPGEQIQQLKQLLSTSLKTSSPNSVVWRLSLALIEAYHTVGSAEALAQLWTLIVAELRHHFERGVVIPSIEHGAPNLGMCMLHQKIQMLNCCIETRNARQRRSATTVQRVSSKEPRQSNYISNQQQLRDYTPPRNSNVGVYVAASMSAQEESDEDFFDCSETSTTASNIGRKSLTQHEFFGTCSGDIPGAPHSFEESPSVQDEAKLGCDDTRNSTCRTPEGRLKPFGSICLLDFPNERAWIPCCQQSSPMTEDMLQEQADTILKLASHADGQRLTARLQSASLFSDMQSFKAANPGCRLEDFVRWFSPRDWTEPARGSEGNIVTEGELSQRMTIPGNIWVDLWSQAKPIPAARQQRLFDDTKEGERILHELLAMSLGEIAKAIFPCIIHFSLEKICENVLDGPRDMNLSIKKIILETKQVLRSKEPNFAKLVQLIYKAEVDIARTRALRKRLTLRETVKDTCGSSLKLFLAKKHRNTDAGDLENLILDLMEKTEVTIEGGQKGTAGAAITTLFENAQMARTDGGISSSSYSGAPSAEAIPEPHVVRRLPPSQQFPTPIGKEFILRTRFPRPSSSCRESAHRMYIVLTPNEFRLIGAFSEDMLFF